MTRIVASDIVSMNYCARRLWYEYNSPAGLEEVELDPFDSLIIEMGHEHEHTIYERLADEFEVVEATSLDHTQELMAQGAPVIYQAQLLDKSNQLFGKPDFLILHNDGTYQAADAKLAQSVNKEIGIQLAFYHHLLGSDHPGRVYLGTGEVSDIGPEYDARLNTFVIEARSVLSDDTHPIVRYSETKCTACPFYGVCHPDFVASEELTLLYGVESRSAPGLEKHGISTITELSKADPESIPDIPYLKGERKYRSVLQAQAWKTGEITKLNDIVMPKGTWVHFDIEVNPLTPDGHQHVYLWGFLKPPYRPEDFEYVWVEEFEDDEDGWREFLAKVDEYRAEWPDLRLVHFADYERARIAAYAKRYQMESHETVAWLLDKESGPLYDIQNAVTDNLVLPLSGYGLKNICKHPDLVNFQWEDDGSGSQWSVVQFNNLLRTENGDERQTIKDAILTYNRDDVRATRMLEEWLRSL